MVGYSCGSYKTVSSTSSQSYADIGFRASAGEDDLLEIVLIQVLLCRYIPAVGRFLIVCTFIEDAIRIMTQWNDQLLYLHDYRHSMYLIRHRSLHAASSKHF